MAGRSRVSEAERKTFEKALRYMPAGSNGNMYTDVIIDRGRGSRVWDISGNEYVDYVLGSGPMLIGHGHSEVVQAVVEQAERGFTTSGSTSMRSCLPRRS